MSRIFVKLLGLTGGNKITIPIVYNLFIPSGSDSLVTSDSLTFKVKSA